MKSIGKKQRGFYTTHTKYFSVGFWAKSMEYKPIKTVLGFDFF